MVTPRITEHARQRCAEMGISTKVAKRILRDPGVVHGTGRYGSDGERFIASSDVHPEYVVVFFYGEDGVPVVATVMFRAPGTYERDGAGYRLVGH